ncbi:MAG: universal stress protein [Betaproteobacteria bacterium]|nr:universal stress protein [Betaproteobacteria bacterium]
MAYERILVALDGSDIAERALREAIKLARQGHSRLRLVHVVDESPLWQVPERVGVNYEGLVERFREVGQQICAAALEAARQAGIEADSALLELSGPGRVAEGVSRSASVPVLLVR